MKTIEIEPEGELYKQALTLRYELFFKRHDLPWSILFDDKESVSNHMAIINDKLLLAYGRITKREGNIYQISQMVVSPNAQRTGIGSILLKELLSLAHNNGCHKIVLNARIEAKEFYEKLGFKCIGEIFCSKTTNIPHIKMIFEYNHT